MKSKKTAYSHKINKFINTLITRHVKETSGLLLLSTASGLLPPVSC